MSATEQVNSNILTTNTHHGLHTKYMRGTLRNPGLDRYPRLVRSICLVSFGFTFQYLGYTYTQILGLADLMTSSSSPSSLACLLVLLFRIGVARLVAVAGLGVG